MEQRRLLLCNFICKLDRFINVRIECINSSIPLVYEGQLRKYFEFKHYGVIVDSVVVGVYVDERDYLCIQVFAPCFRG